MTQATAARVAELNRLGAQAGNAGRFAQAVERFREAVVLAPASPELRANLGAALCRSGQAEQGMRELRDAARLDPGNAHALAALTREARAAGGEAGVIAELESLIAHGHDGAELRCRLVQALTRVGRSADAAAHAEVALSCDPRGVETPLRLARIASAVSSHDTAVVLYARAHALAPGDEEIAGALADSLIELGELARAARILDRAAAEPAPRMRLARARLNVERQRIEAARADLEAAHRALGSAESARRLAEFHHRVGEAGRAAVIYRDLARRSPELLHAFIDACGFEVDDEVVQHALDHAGRPGCEPRSRYALLSAVARVYDRRGDPSRALALMSEAQAIAAAMCPYDADAFERRCERIAAVFDEPRLRRTAVSESARPIFIVGMPRSGTTLVEQILSASPQVFAAGELGYLPALCERAGGGAFPDNFTALAEGGLGELSRRYLAALDVHDATAGRVTDKLPHNFLNVGAIRVLFPRAAIVHVRRQPADVALSTYFARFGPRTGNLAYHARWSWIAHHLGAYERLMAHWRAQHADAWFELDYERLTAQPQAVTAELAAFLGLHPAPQMPAALSARRWVHTASTSQIGDAIHDRSVGRWRRYEAMLPEEIRALAR